MIKTETLPLYGEARHVFVLSVNEAGHERARAEVLLLNRELGHYVGPHLVVNRDPNYAADALEEARLRIEDWLENG